MRRCGRDRMVYFWLDIHRNVDCSCDWWNSVGEKVMKDVKQKAIELLPAIAVFGVTAIAVYGITKIVKAAKDIDFPLDFGYDANLEKFIGK